MSGMSRRVAGDVQRDLLRCWSVMWCSRRPAGWFRWRRGTHGTLVLFLLFPFLYLLLLSLLLLLFILEGLGRCRAQVRFAVVSFQHADCPFFEINGCPLGSL